MTEMMTETTTIRKNPYPGPVSFQIGETLYGRRRETRQLLNLLIAERIVLLYSPSGAGKTSLIQAALIPELEREGFRVFRPARVSLAAEEQISGVTNRYIFSLLLSWEANLPDGTEPLPHSELATMTLADYLARRTPQYAAATDDAEDESLAEETWAEEWHGDVLIFDQFEEILTVDPTDREAKHEFFRQVGEVLQDRQRWALFAMREEFLAGLDPYLRPIPTRFATTFRLELLGPDAARQAMQKPAEAQGVTFTDAAAEQLIDDLRRVQVMETDGSTHAALGETVEPVQLQVVCLRLWNGLAADDDEIGVDDVNAFGDVDSALRAYYTETVDRIAQATDVGGRLLREWVNEQLITESGIRGQVLMGQDITVGLANVAIWQLVDAHLVRAEKRRGATWFELAHDRLLEPVQEENEAWFAANLTPFQRQAAAWDKAGRSEGLVLHGAELTAIIKQFPVLPKGWTVVEEEYYAACRVAWERAERDTQQKRRIQWLAVGASMIAVIAIGLGVWGWIQQRNATAEALRASAKEQEAIAQADLAATREVDAVNARATAEAEAYRAEKAVKVAHSRQLAAQSANARVNGNSELAMALAIESALVTDTLESYVVINESMQQPWSSRVLYINPSNGLIQWSDDGRHLLTYECRNGNDYNGECTQKTIAVWDLPRQQKLFNLNNGDDITFEAWNHDNSRILTVTCQGNNQSHCTQRWATIWDAETGKALGNFDQPNNLIHSVTWSRDEQQILTTDCIVEPTDLSCSQNVVRIWDAETGRILVEWPHYEGPIWTAEWSRDERYLATVGCVVLTEDQFCEQSAVWIWESASGEQMSQFLNLEGDISEVIWNRNGDRVITVGCKILADRVGYYECLEESAQVWDIATGEGLAQYNFDDNVYSFAWLTNDRSIFIAGCSERSNSTGCIQSKLQIWEVESNTLHFNLTLESGLTQVIFSQDEQRLLTSSVDGTIRIWDIDSAEEVTRFELQNGIVKVEWYQREGVILAVVADGTVLLWNEATGDELIRIKHDSIHIEAKWNSHTGEIVTASYTDQTIRVWNVDHGNGPFKPIHSEEGVSSAYWLANDSQILTVGTDDTIRLWQAESAQEIRKITPAGGNIKMLGLMQDERQMVTIGCLKHDLAMGTCQQQAVQLWDRQSGNRLAEFTYEGYLRPQRWDESTNQLLTTNCNDQAQNYFCQQTNIRRWDMKTGELSSTLTFAGDFTSFLRWSQDKQKILAAVCLHYQQGYRCDSSAIYLWNSESGELLFRYKHDSQINWVSWNHTEQRILFVGCDEPESYGGCARESVHIVDIQSGQEVRTLPYSGNLFYVDLNEDQTKLLITSCAGASGFDFCNRATVYIWDIESGRLITTLTGHRDYIWVAQWSQDESKLLTGSNDGTVRVWDLQSGTELLRLVHNGEISQAEWGQDEQKIFTSGGGTVRIWAAQSGTELIRIEDSTFASWSSDEKKILTVTGEGTVRVWFAALDDLVKAACQKLARNLTEEEWDKLMETEYRPTCAQAPIPPDAIQMVTTQVADLAERNDLIAAAERLEQLLSWLHENGQFETFGFDLEKKLRMLRAGANPWNMEHTAGSGRRSGGDF